MKKLVSLMTALTTLLLPLSMLHVIAQDEITVSVSDTQTASASDEVADKAQIVVENITAEAGKDIEVAVNLENNPGIVAMCFNVNYDTDALELVSVEDSGLMKGSTFTAGGDVKEVPYKVMWENGLAKENYSESGTVAVLHFHVKDTAKGKTDVSVSIDKESTFNVDLDNVAFEEVKGSVQVGEEPAEKAQVKVANVTADAGTDVDVAVNLENNPGIVAMCFNVNYDTDALELVSVEDSGLMKGSTFTAGGDVKEVPYKVMWENGLAKENYSESGTVAVLHFHVKDTAKGKTDVSVSVDKESTFNVDLDNVAFEEVKGSVQVGEEPVEKAQVKVANVTAKAGTDVDVAVNLENNPGIVAMCFNVNYDADALELVSVEDSGLMKGSTFTAGGDVKEVPYKVMWENGLAKENYSESGTVAVLHFHVKDTAKGKTDVSVSVDKESTFNVNLNNIAFEEVKGTISVSEPPVVVKGQITVANATAVAGKEIDVPVNVEKNPGITAMSFNVQYDSERLELISVKDGGLLKETTFTAGGDVKAVPYKVMWENGLANENYSETGTIAILHFRVKGFESGIAKVSITVDNESTFNVDMNNVAFDTVDGTMTITESIDTTPVDTAPGETTTTTTTSDAVSTSAESTTSATETTSTDMKQDTTTSVTETTTSNVKQDTTTTVTETTSTNTKQDTTTTVTETTSTNAKQDTTTVTETTTSNAKQDATTSSTETTATEETTTKESEVTTTNTEADATTTVIESTTTATETAIETMTTEPIKYFATNEELCNMSIRDYQIKTGFTPSKAELATNENGSVIIKLTNENGAVMDTYVIDPATGKGKDTSGSSVNLPKTGNNSFGTVAAIAGALSITMAGAFVLAQSKKAKKEDDLKK